MNDDNFTLDNILNPEHEANAKDFADFLKTTNLIGDQDIPSYLKENWLGCFIGTRPVVNITFGDTESPLLSRIASDLQRKLEEEDIQSATTTVIIFSVPLGSLNQTEDALDEVFLRQRDTANQLRAMLKEMVSEEKLAELKTGRQVYEEAWARHRERRLFLNEIKLGEIQNNLISVINSDVVTQELSKLGGKVAESNLVATDSVLLYIEFEFC